MNYFTLFLVAGSSIKNGIKFNRVYYKTNLIYQKKKSFGTIRKAECLSLNDL